MDNRSNNIQDDDIQRLNKFYDQFRNDNQAIKQDYLNLNENELTEANSFFSNYGAGLFNNDPEEMGYGYRNHLGRVGEYIDLLSLLKKWDSKKFKKIHKGTPYCFLGWLLIDSNNFDQAIFYMDAAISEDKRNDPNNWLKTPATRFMFFEIDKYNDNAIQKRMVPKLRKIFRRDILRFKKIIKSSKKFTLPNLINKFVKPKISIDSHRTLVSSLYIYVLEGNSLQKILELRSEGKGSIEPFLTNLHRGCLIMESLLKEIYPSLGSRTLGNILLKNEFVKQDLKIKLESFSGVDATLEDIIKNIIPNLNKKNIDIQNQWFSVAYALRNVTSHNLLWPDMFDEKSFKVLYEYVLFSILYLIKEKYLQV